MTDQHERLKEARLKAGFKSAADGARFIGVPVEGYRHHENGIRGYNYDKAERYARAYKTTPEWLMGGKQKSVPELGPRQTRPVTLLSWVGAGRLGPVAPIESVESSGTLMVERLPPGEFVGLSVEGASMDRVAIDGSTIIVNRKDKTLVSGKFYVFVASDGEATFKRYRANPERFVPYSTNPDEEPIYPDFERDRDWECFGRVCRVMTDL